MVTLILFIVFLVLWLCTLIPAPANPVAPYGGIFAWLWGLHNMRYENKMIEQQIKQTEGWGRSAKVKQTILCC